MSTAKLASAISDSCTADHVSSAGRTVVGFSICHSTWPTFATCWQRLVLHDGLEGCFGSPSGCKPRGIEVSSVVVIIVEGFDDQSVPVPTHDWKND